MAISARTMDALRATSAGPDRAHRAARRRLVAAVFAVVGMGSLQLVQHELFMHLPMFWYHAIATVLGGAVVTAMAIMYLEWRAAALMAEDALRHLRASEALREDMTHMLIHDLKNPLTASMGCSEILLRGGAALSEKDRELLRISVASQTRLVGMIGDLLDIARGEDGTMPLTVADADVGSSILGALDEARLTAARAGVQLVSDIQACARVPCDEEKVRRVVTNLLANSVKNTPRGGRVTVSLRLDDAEAHVTVSDTGIGIPESMLALIFDKFGQVRSPGVEHRMSVGLGLAFCKLAVEAHGGRIWVSSSPGRGSTFGFALPLSAAAA